MLASTKDINGNIKGYQISLSWDYPDDWSLKDIEDTIFYILEEQNKPRSISQFITESIQSAGTGVHLCRSVSKKEKIPCEIHFANTEISVELIGLVVISEAKHVELYLDDIYEKTSKGCMITVKKGNQSGLYESELDITHSGVKKVTLKFLSLAEKDKMRLQTVIMKLRRVSNSTGLPHSLSNVQSSAMDMENMKQMIQTLGFQVPIGAQKLMSEIAGHQKQQQQMLQNLSGFPGNPLLQFFGRGQQIPPQVTTEMQQMFSSMMGLNGVPVPEQMSQLELSTTEKVASETTLPNSLFPVSRENISPTEKKARRPKSMSSLEKFDGFGTPNPSDESVLINALINFEQHKKTAESRALQTSEKNYESAQIELVKRFLAAEDAMKFSVTKTSSQNSLTSDHEKPKRARNARRRPQSLPPRPLSLTDCPSNSEVDFTNLLRDLITEENCKKNPADGSKQNSNSMNSRWEAYLRSRIRASQRDSSSPGDGDVGQELGRHFDSSSDSGGGFSPNLKTCKECGCHNDMYSELIEQMNFSEQRINQHFNNKIKELTDSVNLQFDTINKNLMSFHAAFFDAKYYDDNTQNSTV